MAQPGHAQAASPPDSVRDDLAQAMLDTAAAHIAALEVTRARMIGVGKSPAARDLADVEKQLAALRHYVDELPQPQSARAYVNGQVVRVLDANLASVNVSRRLLAALRASNDREIQALAGTAAVLERRRAELQAHAVGTNRIPQG